MSCVTSQWAHSARSIDTLTGNFTHSVTATLTPDGVATVGIVAANSSGSNQSQILAGVTIQNLIPGLSSGQYLITPIIGSGANSVTLPPVQTTTTNIHISHVNGTWVITAGGGTTVVDGTTVPGSAIIAQVPVVGPVPAVQTIAAFNEPGNSIETTASSFVALSAATVTGTAPLTTDTDLSTVTPDANGNIAVAVDSSGGTINLTLPSSPTNGQTVTVTNTGPNPVFVNPAPGQTINGSTSPVVVPPGGTVEFTYDSSANNWVVSNANAPPVATTNPWVYATLPLGIFATAVDGLVAAGALGDRANASLEIPVSAYGVAVPQSIVGNLTYAVATLPVDIDGTLADISVRSRGPDGGTAHVIPLAFVAGENEENRAQFRVPLTISGFMSGAPIALPYFEAVFYGLFSTTSQGGGAFDIVEGALAITEVDEHYVNLVRELCNALATPQTFWATTAEVSEAVLAATAVNLAAGVELTDGASAGEATFVASILFAIEQAVATGQAETHYQAAAAIAEAAEAASSASPAYAFALADTAEAAASIARIATAIAQLIDVAEAADSSEARLTIAVSEVVRAEAADSVELTAQYLAEILENATAAVSLRLPDEGYVGWVMNTEGRQPLSEYRNFNFNSFAEIDDTYYAAGETGIYRLEGGTDDGDPIDASLKTLMLDFGTSRMKRLRSAYLGYTADGRLMLRVKAVNSGDGELVEYWFEALDLPADAYREQRLPLAMGMRSRYWQFELVNVDGADFEVDEMELHPVVLTRRV